MTFVKGKSGNPAGRRPGSRNKVTQLVEEILEGGAEQATRELLNHACLGKATAMRICFDQLLPRRRGRPVPISLPRVETLADVDKWKVAILNGIADGEVTPEEAVELMKVIDNAGRKPQAAEIDARVARLEQAVATLLGKNAGMPEGGLASATNLQVHRAPAGATPPAEPAARPNAPLASARNLQAERAPAGAIPPAKPAAPDEAPLASATNLQAERAPAGAIPPAKPAAPDEAPLASARNLQAERAAASATPPPEPAARPDAPLASATNLQALPVRGHADPPPDGAAADQLGWRDAA